MEVFQFEGADQQLPKYRCHKEVWALKIKDITTSKKDLGNGIFVFGATITPEEEGYSPFFVDNEYLLKHNPQIGGYYVLYEDNYSSWSPAEAFESGYTRI